MPATVATFRGFPRIQRFVDDSKGCNFPRISEDPEVCGSIARVVTFRGFHRIPRFVVQ